jgi:electron transfer flavoprotein alpha subunit
VSALRVLALVKQIPAFETMALGPDGRLVREGLPLEMSAYCRRAVAKAVDLVEQDRGEPEGEVVVATLGPPSAEDVLREAVAYGTGHGVAIRAVHVCDPVFAGSDTLATAKALAATVAGLEAEGGRFDLILCGRNSVDADTGQVGPELAELLDRPFATGVKTLAVRPEPAFGALVADVGCELDDTWQDAMVVLPAVLSTAERLIDPCKIQDPDVWATVDPATIRRVAAAELGPGPWGAAGSPTTVGEVRFESVERVGQVLEGSLTDQVAAAIAFLADRGALVPGSLHATGDEAVPVPVAAADDRDAPTVAVLIEPDRSRLAGELLGAAARLAVEIGGRVAAFGSWPLDPAALAGHGADEIIAVRGVIAGEDVADALTAWLRTRVPTVWAVLAGSTSWGREVTSRTAAALDAGLTGDAVGLAVDDGRLLAWKPAFGGSLVAAVRSSSPTQLVTVRSGVLPLPRPRPVDAIPAVETIESSPRGRVVTRDFRREDDSSLLTAEMVVGVGKGVDPARYGELDGLRSLLGAELGATRKVTDNGWLPRARQIGITGHTISPRLYVALGMSGKFNHLVGVRSAGTIVAVNTDPDAPVFAAADLGIVARWDDAVPELERQLREFRERHG